MKKPVSPSHQSDPAGHRLRLTVHVQPGARRTEVVSVHEDVLKVRVAAPPAEGQANAELVRFLAQTLGVPRQQVKIIRGASARRKLVEVMATAQAVEALLYPRPARGQ